MRIVYLSAAGQLGGAETSLIELWKAVRQRHPEWELHAVLGEDGPLRAIASGLGLQVTLLPFPVEVAETGDSGTGTGMTPGRLAAAMRAAVSALTYRRRLKSVLDGIGATLIHATGLKMQILGAWARPMAVPFIWHIHDYVSRRPVMSYLLRLHAGRITAALVNSDSVERDFRGLCPSVAVTKVYNAVDLDRFAPAGPAADLDALAGLPPAPPAATRFGLIATYARWKGHLIFLDALKHAVEKAPVRGYIIGGPIYRTQGSQFSLEELRQEVRSRNLEGHVGFIGFQDPAPIIRSLDVVVHASTAPEPFGMVIVEGMACGKPVIASLAGGVEEIVTHGHNALTHSPGNAVELADRMLQFASDHSLRSRLAGAGRERAELLCQGSRLAAQLETFYTALGVPA